MKKTIGIVSDAFPVLTETFIGDEMRALMRQGHCVVPLSLQRPQQECQPQDVILRQQTRYLDQAPAYPLKPLLGLLAWSRQRQCRHFLSSQQSKPTLALLRQGVRLATLAHDAGCAHLHAHFALASAAAAIIAAKLLGITVSFTAHGADIYGNHEDLAAKCQHADWVCAVSHTMARDLMRYGSNVVYQPCGLDLARFPRIPSQLGEQTHLLFFGHLTDQNGVELLLHAFHHIAGQYQTLQLDIVGDGPLQHKLIRKYAHPRVRFLGAQADTWLLQHGADYGALVMPFRLYGDDQQAPEPLFLKEAMALGLPIITTHLASCDEILAGEGIRDAMPIHCAVQLAMNDVHALEQALITHLARSETDLRSQRAQAEQCVRHQFDIDTITALFSQHIESAPHLYSAL